MDKVVHFEIPADDPKRAVEFYKKTFGWDIEQPPGMSDYWLANSVKTDKVGMPLQPGAINGGIMQRERGDAPIIVIKVGDIDAYLKKIEKAGGKRAMERVPIGHIGFYARFRDPEGNIVGLFEDAK